MDKFQVLVIDDDRTIAAWYRSVLILMGFEVEIALTARLALAWLSANVPDLVLLDMRLGQEMGGEDILYQIRSNSRFNNTRVIVITGYPNTTEIINNLADLVMLKPVELEQLRGLVGRMAYSELEPKIQSFRDPATLLFNKEFFLTRLELAFERARRRPEFFFAVIVFQVEFSSLVDDSFHPHSSALVLQEIARRLKQHLRPTDTLAHISGWKFVTLHEELRKTEEVEVIIERLKLLLTEPVKVGDQEYLGAAQFGVSVDIHRYRHPEEIYDAAEHAFQANSDTGKPEPPASPISPYSS